MKVYKRTFVFSEASKQANLRKRDVFFVSFFWRNFKPSAGNFDTFWGWQLPWGFLPVVKDISRKFKMITLQKSKIDTGRIPIFKGSYLFPNHRFGYPCLLPDNSLWFFLGWWSDPLKSCWWPLTFGDKNGHDLNHLEDTIFVGMVVVPKNYVKSDLGGGFKHVLFSPLFEEDSHFD